jgi:hypothetical protein
VPEWVLCLAGAVGGALIWRFATVIGNFLWPGRAWNPLQQWDSIEHMTAAVRKIGLAIMIIDGVLAVVFLAIHA